MSGVDGLRGTREAEKTLKNPVRRRMMDAIRSNPGINQISLAGQLSIHRSTIQYHGRVLEEAGLVVKHRNGKSVCYFPKPVGRTGPGHLVDLILNSEAKRWVVRAVMENDGISQSGIARRLGCVASTVKYHVDALMAVGVLRERERERERERDSWNAIGASPPVRTPGP